MLKKRNKLSKKISNESRHIRDQAESTFENIDEKEEYYIDSDNLKKRQISSEENNINSSIDIEKLSVKKKGKKVKKKNKQEEEIDNTLMQLEKNNKEKMLTGELADLMEEIENENKDFKKNVFFNNFHELSNQLGIFDEEKKAKQTGNYIGVKDNQVSAYGLIDKYTEKAQNLKSNKKKK